MLSCDESIPFIALVSFGDDFAGEGHQINLPFFWRDMHEVGRSRKSFVYISMDALLQWIDTVYWFGFLLARFCQEEAIMVKRLIFRFSGGIKQTKKFEDFRVVRPTSYVLPRVIFNVAQARACNWQYIAMHHAPTPMISETLGCFSGTKSVFAILSLFLFWKTCKATTRRIRIPIYNETQSQIFSQKVMRSPASFPIEKANCKETAGRRKWSRDINCWGQFVAGRFFQRECLRRRQQSSVSGSNWFCNGFRHCLIT